MSYRGGGGGRGGRGGGRSGGGGRGRGGGGGRGRGGGGGGGRGGGSGNMGIMMLCRDFTSTGNCSRGNSCSFMHVVQFHAQINAATHPPIGSKPQHHHHHNNNSNKASVSSISIWEQPNGQPFKIFTGSHDGYWRLWNTAGGQFVQEFESNMNGKVNVCSVHDNQYLFCAFEAICRIVPNVPVGMTHAWNLQQPSQPPLELHVQPNDIPYAHNSAVTALQIVTDTTTNTVLIATGSRDGTIRIWQSKDSTFILKHNLIGHAREVTGLVLLPQLHLLWSGGTDNCIRIWNINTGLCQYTINSTTPAKPPATGAAVPPQPQPQQDGVGHTHAITGLLSYTIANAGPFILSSSLDKTVKVWNATNGECVASEVHTEGVVSMSIVHYESNPQQQPKTELLLLGLESGAIQCRCLQQTSQVQALQLLFTINSHVGVQHNGAVKCLSGGPASTFYSGGMDGQVFVFSFCGDLGLQYIYIYIYI